MVLLHYLLAVVRVEIKYLQLVLELLGKLLVLVEAERVVSLLLPMDHRHFLSLAEMLELPIPLKFQILTSMGLQVVHLVSFKQQAFLT